MSRSPARCLAGAATALVCAALVATAACAPTARQLPSPPAPPAASTASSPARVVIADLKAYEAGVGFTPTGNFAAATSEPFPGRCYYTGTLELPDSYNALHMVAAVDGRCPLDESEYDVFPYALETAATGSSAVTPALEGATLERLLMVVPHEDFHNQPETRRAPPAAAEAAATLAGFVTAAGFAREHFGPDAPVARHLSDEATLFARKATIINRFSEEVAALYADYRAGRVPREQALARKHMLFDELAQACTNSGPAPVSFNRCPAVLNNAGLAFDWTYTREYPRLFEVEPKLGSDVAATVTALKRILADWPSRTRRGEVRGRTDGTSGSAVP